MEGLWMEVDVNGVREQFEELKSEMHRGRMDMCRCRF